MITGNTSTGSNGGLAVVVIGRNEGERLRRCLESVRGVGAPVVYVDSGSTDGSCDLAQALGVATVTLDDRAPYTAARGRNAGIEHVRRIAPEAKYVQFVDGDTCLADGWLEAGRRELEQRSDVAIATGRLRESRPQASIYNRLCEIGWETPSGELRECGGNCMARLEALREVGWFRSDLACGEEPELCLRLRRKGWKIWGVDEEMGEHDAAMTRFGEWWRRSVRTGYGYAEGTRMNGSSDGKFGLRKTVSAAFWGGALPIASLGLAWPTGGWSLCGLAAYPVQWRLIRARRKRIAAHRDFAGVYAFFILLAKYAQFVGLLRYWFGRTAGIWPAHRIEPQIGK